jgi:hypothetical protein
MGSKYSSGGFGRARRHKEPAQRLRHPCAYRRTGDDHVDHRHRLVGVAAGTDMLGRDARRSERPGVGVTTWDDEDEGLEPHGYWSEEN